MDRATVRESLFTPSSFRTEIPDGDVLLHCGDATIRSFKKEFVSFNEWIGALPHPKKIVIAGNHDRFLEIRPLNTFFNVVSSDFLLNIKFLLFQALFDLSLYFMILEAQDEDEKVNDNLVPEY